MKTLKCCMCGEEILDMGHNPYPIMKKGRCCATCNSNLVIPARIKMDKQNRVDPGAIYDIKRWESSNINWFCSSCNIGGKCRIGRNDDLETHSKHHGFIWSHAKYPLCQECKVYYADHDSKICSYC